MALTEREKSLMRGFMEALKGTLGKRLAAIENDVSELKAGPALAMPAFLSDRQFMAALVKLYTPDLNTGSDISTHPVGSLGEFELRLRALEFHKSFATTEIEHFIRAQFESRIKGEVAASRADLSKRLDAVEQKLSAAHKTIAALERRVKS
jgi:hypothetical protein